MTNNQFSKNSKGLQWPLVKALNFCVLMGEDYQLFIKANAVEEFSSLPWDKLLSINDRDDTQSK